MSEEKQLTPYQIAAIEWFKNHPGICYIHLTDPDCTIWSPFTSDKDIEQHPGKAKLFCEVMGIGVDPDFEVGEVKNI
jgi:hypothetical protein